MKRIFKSFVGVAMVATSTLMVGGSLPAHAATGAAVCSVDGRVTTSPGLSSVPSFGSYTFVGVTITCQGAPLSGAFSVNASGSTHSLTSTTAGEDCNQGAGENGSITVKQGATTSTNGTVSFKRVGTAVVATGSFDFAGNHASFTAPLVFIPTNAAGDPAAGAQIAANACGQTPTQKVNNALLEGTAVVTSS